MATPPPAAGPLDAFDYELPPELIAQEPPPTRGASRLLVLDRRTGKRELRAFRDIAEYFGAGDLLVLNETRVFPARLRARRPSGGKVEVLLLEPRAAGGNTGENSSWTALARPARSLRPGVPLGIEPADAARGAAIHPIGREGEKVILEIREGDRPLGASEVLDLCERAGETPLPPYIRREPARASDPRDRERYQTVYARHVGSAAAPTAGLHFTDGILESVRGAGVGIARVTLHVGLGTFQPLTGDSFARNTLHAEWAEASVEAGREILRARAEGRRVIAAGTTTVRAVESFLASGELPYRSRTELFIKPGYTFRGVSALITNFHLPRSSLLVLVSAFAGRELILDAYREAVREGYRFYSFGDAMLIL